MIVSKLPPPLEDEAEEGAAEPEMKVAIVGRRNVGKSTFINTLVSAPRMIVSEVPGTTRDSVDVRFELDGKPFVAIDTPGIRRAKSRQTDIDFYGTHRAQRSIRRADVVFLFFDATQRISKVDKQLCDYIAQQYKPCIFVVNKWDQLVNSMPTGQLGPLLARRIRHDALRADRVHHRPDRQKREGPVEPRADAVQASRDPAYRPGSSIACSATRCGRTRRRTRRIGSRRFTTPRKSASSRRRSCCSRTTPSSFRKRISAYLLGKFRDELTFDEVPIKLYLRRRHPADLRDDVGAHTDGEASKRPREVESEHQPADAEIQVEARRQLPHQLGLNAKRIGCGRKAARGLPLAICSRPFAGNEQSHCPRRNEADHFSVGKQLLPIPMGG